MFETGDPHDGAVVGEMSRRRETTFHFGKDAETRDATRVGFLVAEVLVRVLVRAVDGVKCAERAGARVEAFLFARPIDCLLYTSPSPRDPE